MLKERFENKVTTMRCAVAGVAVSAPLALCTITSFAAEGDAADPLITACTSIASSVSYTHLPHEHQADAGTDGCSNHTHYRRHGYLTRHS